MNVTPLVATLSMICPFKFCNHAPVTLRCLNGLQPTRHHYWHFSFHVSREEHPTDIAYVILLPSPGISLFCSVIQYSSVADFTVMHDRLLNSLAVYELVCCDVRLDKLKRCCWEKKRRFTEKSKWRGHGEKIDNITGMRRIATFPSTTDRLYDGGSIRLYYIILYYIILYYIILYYIILYYIILRSDKKCRW